MANYYVLLTDYGRSFIANAQAGTQLALTHVVLGDANGQPYLPESRVDKTALVHQVAKLPVASVTVINSTTAEVNTIIPSTVGGWNLHEIGITDSSGKLVYVGNFHGGYRPTLTEGAGGDMELIFTITASNLATVVIDSDSTVVTATRDWVTERFVTKPEFQVHLDAANPHSQYVLHTVYDPHVTQNAVEHDAFTAWQTEHLSADNPHPQYPLSVEIMQVINDLNARVVFLESELTRGDKVAVIDITFSDTSKSSNDFTGDGLVVVNEQNGFAFQYPPTFNLLKPIGNFPNSYDQLITIGLPSEYDIVEHRLVILNNNGSYVIDQSTRSVRFSTPVTSQRSGEDGIVTDTMAATFRIEMYNL